MLSTFIHLLYMQKDKKTITLSIGSLNVRGFGEKKKRNAIMRQANNHFDITLYQDTHIDGNLSKQICKEWNGPWAFANYASNKGGVAMYLNNQNKARFVENDLDEYDNGKGSIVGRTVDAGPMKLYLLSAYAPCCSKSSQTENLSFLKSLEKIIMEKKSKGFEVIVTGDLNFIRDPNLDASGGKPTVYKAQADWLHNMEDNFNMIDAFRFLRPDERMYTFSPSGPNVKNRFRRLDYLLCSKKMLEMASEDLIVAVPTSDHRLIGIKFILGEESLQGRGLWRHNDTCLKEEDYVNEITKCIKSVKEQKFQNITAQWEYCKFKVRESSMKYGKKRAKERKDEKRKAEEKYAKALESNSDEQTLSELGNTLHKIYEWEDDVIRFRAGLDHTEKGEKITSFFFRAIDYNRKASNVTRLKTDEHPAGTISREETMKAIEKHYKATFSDKEKNVPVPESWWQGLNKIPQELSNDLDAEVTRNDIAHTLFKRMQGKKAPGNDGLTVSFYQVFWTNISDMVVGSLREGWERGTFSNSQRQSVIRLIEKKGKDKERMNGWRPISLMNLDIKLFSKVLGERLRRICKEVIGEEQLAYIESIDIHEGHILINKVLELAREKKVSGLMTTVDFKGAFDSIKHSFIWKTLKEMGVGENLISLLKCLYNQSVSSVLNFGTTTQFFDLERSCRQGDPVAAYLFIIVMEVLLNKLRNQGGGFYIGGTKIWGSAFADDLTLFSNNCNELKASLETISAFKTISGLEINSTKSEVLELNCTYDPSIGIPKVNHAKITGIWYCLDYDQMLKLNWENVISRVAGKLNLWKGRHLSELGKSTVVKAQISPIVLYTGSVVPLPPNYEKELSKMTFRFIGNGSEKETRALLCQKKDKGGLEIPYWRARCRSALALWAVKATKSTKPWTKSFQEPGINWQSTDALSTIRSHHWVDGFAGICVSEWYRTASLAKTSNRALIWPYIKSISVSKMLRKKCPALTFEDAEIELPESLNFLEKTQIKACLEPAKRDYQKQKEWVSFEGKKLLHLNLNCVRWPKPVYNRDGTLRPIGEGRLKDFINELSVQTEGLEDSSLNTLKSIYWLHISHIIPPTHPFRSRIELELGPIEWGKLDKEKISIYSRQQSFHWRSTHGKLYGNRQYKGMGFKKNAECSYCDEKSQTINHLFLDCNYTQQLFACFKRQFKMDRNLTDIEKLIGMDPSQYMSKLLRKKLNILRRLIYQKNYKDEKLRWQVYIDALERVYVTEYAIADRNGRVLQHLQHWEK